MRVGLVYNKNHGQFEYEAEFDSQITIDALTEALSYQHQVVQIESTRDMTSFVQKLSEEKPDVLFNVSEGYFGPAREAFYPALFDQLGLTYAGPDATNLTICHNKTLCKFLLSQAGLSVPAGIVINSGSIAAKQVAHLTFPLFTKLNSEGSGMGISEYSIVSSFDELVVEVKRNWKKFQRHIVIEEYIEGKDVSMVFIEEMGAMGPCEVISEDESKVYDYEHKTSKDSIVSIGAAKSISVKTKKKLKEMVLTLAQVLDLKGYAKIDFRLDKDENPYILEVNAQVSYHPQGEFMVCVESEGYSMRDVLEHSVKLASQRKATAHRFSVGIQESYFKKG